MSRPNTPTYYPEYPIGEHVKSLRAASATPADYFEHENQLDRQILRFDFDNLQGAEVRESLANYAYASRFQDGSCGPRYLLNVYLAGAQALAQLRRPHDPHAPIDPDNLDPHWYAYFDVEFQTALNHPDDYVIFTCLTLDGSRREDHLIHTRILPYLNIPDDYYQDPIAD